MKRLYIIKTTYNANEVEAIITIIVEVFFLTLLVPFLQGIFMLAFQTGFLFYGLFGMSWSKKRKEKLPVMVKIPIAMLGAAVIVGVVWLLI